MSDTFNQSIESPVPVQIPIVPIHDIASAEVPEPSFIVDRIVPADVVTLFGGHGGTGKTYLALQMAVAVATGQQFLGLPVQHQKVLFYSAEDGASIIRSRLKKICREMNIDYDLTGQLTVLNATDIDPALYREKRDQGIKSGVLTDAFLSLRYYVKQSGARLIILDNASDTYDAEEIDRARVREFIRALAMMARNIGGAVVLLAHIDKATAKGITNQKEGYSGSTAWHNSVRSRLFLSSSDGGRLTLEHQKANLGPTADPINMRWTDGLIRLEGDTVADPARGLIEAQQGRTILKLIAEFYDRGEFIPTSHNAPGNAWKALSSEKDFPRDLVKSEFQRLMRDMERAGHIERETYVNNYRKERERWRVCEAGISMLEMFGDAPSAST